jgi:tetratricopeptide (TPR) repeat protein
VRGVIAAALAIGLPAFLFALWPLIARRGTGTLLPLPPDAREPLMERKRALLRALRELDFEHEAGHIADDDHADLRARYEAEAAEIIGELDALGPAEPSRPTPAPPVAVPRGWRHPAAVAAGAVALLVFGIALGAGVVRYTTPDPSAGTPPTGSRPLAPPLDSAGASVPGAGGSAPGPGGSPVGAGGPPAGPTGSRQDTGGSPTGAPGTTARALSPEMLQGMLQAARASLFEGRYSEAIAAYQAVLKRDPKNVDALTHLGLIVGMGGHADQALETLDRALALDPNYPPALLYKGQILLESKRDPKAAVASWEKFVAVAPPGEDRDRVVKMIQEARAPR